MAVCLEYQAIYQRKPLVISTRMQQLVVGLLLLAVLVTKVWVKVECTDLGYQLAAEHEKTVEYSLQRRELEFKRSVLLRPDALRARAEALGLRLIVPEQARRIVLR